MAYFVQNFLLIIFLKTIWANQIPPTQKIAKTVEKSAPCFGLNFLETGTEIEKTLSMIFPSLFDDFKTLFGLIIFLEIRNILFRKSILID